MLCTNFWKERLQQPLRIFVNGQERMIEDFGYMRVVNKDDLRAGLHEDMGHKTPLKSMKDLNRQVLNAFEEKNWDQNLVVILGEMKTAKDEQFSLILHAFGVRDCQMEITEFFHKLRSFSSSSDFVFHLDFSNGGMDPFIWHTIVESGSFFYKEDEAYLVNGEWLSTKNLDQIDPSSIHSMTFLKPAYAKQQYGEQGANGVVVLEAD